MASHLDGQGYPLHLDGEAERGSFPLIRRSSSGFAVHLAMVAAPLWVKGITAVINAAACPLKHAHLYLLIISGIITGDVLGYLTVGIGYTNVRACWAYQYVWDVNPD